MMYLYHIARYIATVLLDGDWKNDWLTRFYDPAATMLAYLGMALAHLTGA